MVEGLLVPKESKNMEMKIFGRSNLPLKCPERKGHCIFLVVNDSVKINTI